VTNSKARRIKRISIGIKDSSVGFQVARTEGPIPWIAVLSAPSIKYGEVVLLPRGNVYVGNFVVETKKLTQDGCSANVVFVSLCEVRPYYVKKENELPQINSDARLELNSKQYCDCRYELRSEDIERVSCSCKVSGMEVGQSVYFAILVEICEVTFTATWNIEGK
jgi:hypothetical protein